MGGWRDRLLRNGIESSEHCCGRLCWRKECSQTQLVAPQTHCITILYSTNTVCAHAVPVGETEWNDNDHVLQLTMCVCVQLGQVLVQFLCIVPSTGVCTCVRALCIYAPTCAPCYCVQLYCFVCLCVVLHKSVVSSPPIHSPLFSSICAPSQS